MANSDNPSLRAACTPSPKFSLYRPGIHTSEILSWGPSVFIVVIIMILVGLAHIFLDYYVISAQTAVVVFVVGSYVVFSSYFTFDYYLKQYSKSYARIEPEKQFYVISNLIKSSVLLVYSPTAILILYSTLWLDVWPTSRIRIMGTLYAIPDFVSLFMVKRMMWSTIIHHIVVCVFNTISLYNDYTNENICRNIMIYAIFSTFAYLVNLLLASRWMRISRTLSIVLSSLAFVIYALCCCMNWTWQAFYLRRLFLLFHHWSIYCFIAMMVMIVWDDIILLKWLLKNVQTKMAQTEEYPPSPTKKKKNN